MSGKRSKIEDKIILEDVCKLLTRKDDFLHIIKIMVDLFEQTYPNVLKVRNLIKPPFLQTNIVSLNPAQARCTRYNIIQLMTLDEVNTTTYQPQRSDYHRGLRPSAKVIIRSLGLINRGIN